MPSVVLAHGSGIDDLALVVGAGGLVYVLYLTLKRSERQYRRFDYLDDGTSDGDPATDRNLPVD